MSLRELFTEKKKNVEKYILNFYARAPLTKEYKNHDDNYLFYLVPVMNLMSFYLKDDEKGCSVDNNLLLLDLENLAISCFWIINKYEDDCPIDYYDIRQIKRYVRLEDLEKLEMQVLKKIEYRVSDYMIRSKDRYLKKNIFKNEVVTPPHKLKTAVIGGKPPLYVRPRSGSVSVLPRPPGSSELSIPPQPPSSDELPTHTRKRPRSITY